MKDKAKFIVFFMNSQKYITISVIVFALLLTIISIFCVIKQFRNTNVSHKEKVRMRF
ncbi:hypothetical protein HSX44_03745 [Wolbachia endosymbiont of Onchocerca gibsoni]|uniref:hypothetical protein n=1 Tax=Wolbachia endosymbiont of Onchocerca gibsoni TaxID=118986 RepID=UPI0023D85C32|nr:hypothetical protein [Wolbachia endosymbiont of Onchocerca gibsoni]MDF0607965.1 hypothetical protein [Wolbachia endosymbiont of Onchocerca gibsoni]